MTTRKTIKNALDKTSKSDVKVAGKEGEGDEARVVVEGGVAPDAAHGPRIESKEAPDAAAEPIPNVQSETQHASQAPEDVRDASVALPGQGDE